MSRWISLFPDHASSMAANVDLLYVSLVVSSAGFTLLIFALILWFAVRYRSGTRVNRHLKFSHHTQNWIEVGWTVVPLVIVMASFAWGATLFFAEKNPPANALQFYIVGKQWMWKVQHAGGRREINSLHIPVGRDVQLNMISEDVIHSFYLPAFRTKQDVLPGRYSTQWFYPNKLGTYHLFCAEYCGTEHSNMIGTVVVQTPKEYARWLSKGDEEPLSSQGRRVYQHYRCYECHDPEQGLKGPSLRGIQGTPVELQSGEVITADTRYIRRSIKQPDAQLVKGFSAVMPAYPQMTEEEILLVVAYLQSMEDRAPR